jgi:hypothetical protein
MLIRYAFGICFVNLHNKFSARIIFLYSSNFKPFVMKKVILIAGILSLVVSSCTNMKLVTNNDDVYASPADDKRERERIALERKKADEAAAKKAAEELAAQKAKDDANPAYKDPQYSKDDYYDYQYASRIRRFNNNVSGLGYYDNWYTNYYWYNQNPSMYGTSIYSSYNYWGSGYGYNPYGGGMSYNYGYPNYGYGNPYSYGYNSPYNSYGNGYMNGYNNGFYNGFYGYPYGYNSFGYNPYGYNPYYNSYPSNNSWGYYNSYDANSSYSKTYAPRGSHDGGNGSRMSLPGKDIDNSYVAKYIHNVVVAQENTPKFTDVKQVGSVRSNEGFHNQSMPVETINTVHTVHYNNTANGSGNNGNFNTYNPNQTVVPVKSGISNPSYSSPGVSVSPGGNSMDNYNGQTTSEPRVVQPFHGPKNVSTIEEPVHIIKQVQTTNGNTWNQPQQYQNSDNVPSRSYNPPANYNPPSNPQPSYQSAPRSEGNMGGNSRPR